MDVLVSACLVGENCKYSGGNNLNADLVSLLREKGFRVVLVCPEVMGGLPTPRPPSERRDGGVYSIEGVDVTKEFALGAQIALERVKKHGIKAAILKANSPSCGSGTIYDGTFTGTLTEGDGMTAQLLKEHGVKVYNETNFLQILSDFYE